MAVAALAGLAGLVYIQRQLDRREDPKKEELQELGVGQQEQEQQQRGGGVELVGRPAAAGRRSGNDGMLMPVVEGGEGRLG